MDQVKQDLQNVLAGEALTEDDIIDIKSVAEENFVPITKKTVAYIVSGVFFNEKNEVLMMQEAKRSCYQMWYLPAGRMELNETIEEGVAREVLEETGLICKPTTLLSLEFRQGHWYRFTMTGVITGGKLKSTNESDEESLQANWFSIEAIRKSIPIRCKDIFKLIDIAAAYRNSPVKRVDIRPAIKSHKKLLLRLVVVQYNSERNEMVLLVGCKKRNHLPVKLLSDTDFSLEHAVFKVFQKVFGGKHASPQLHGVISVEHCGRPAALNDGICISVLVSLKDAVQTEISLNDLFMWLPIDDDSTKKEILERKLDGQTVVVPP